MATTSNNITTPNAIREMPLIHQRHTRSSNPFHIHSNDDNNDDTVVDLVGNVGDMSATRRADTSMSANFPDIPFFANILSCQFGRSHAF
jgi:hypothetical protein